MQSVYELNPGNNVAGRKGRKLALVTGASGDMGRAISQVLARDGMHVLLHAHQNPENADRLAAKIRQSGGSAETLQFDVCDNKLCEKILAQICADQAIQVLVSNAGIQNDAPMAGMGPQQWNDVVDVNLNGFFNVCQPLLLPMARTRWGRIIAVSSIAAKLGNRGQSNYAAAKAGLESAVRSLSQEMASRGITANCVAPGVITGKMTEGVFDDGFIKQMIPAKRAGEPEEVAELIGFLASERSAYITGQVIGINGGMA